ncbi:Kinesin light chain [Beauveria bassiana D1-5]|uniref:Kinesin light chain n=1 Tax=Beauveria bassiana D1-5 TaxID=1245745 RepID=A0A0A2V9F2_BEABA|nr:Kinesin light chain [Beauveria bassiana D1-5]
MASGIRVLVDPTQHDAANINKDEAMLECHRRNSWNRSLRGQNLGRERAKGEDVNWLTSLCMLPKAVPTARIMRFGYESAWYGTDEDKPKKTHVFDVAEMLLKEMEIYPRTWSGIHLNGITTTSKNSLVPWMQDIALSRTHSCGLLLVRESILENVLLAPGSEEHRKQRHFLVPFGRNEAFVGRDVVLDALRKRLPPTAHPHDCQRTAVEGLGGIGKTQNALEAAYYIHDAHPDCSVFWVPAVDPASLDRAYRDIGHALGVKGLDDEKADVRVLVHAALTMDDVGPCLWIIDNADERELLFGKPWTLKNLPFNRNGSILITTRNHEVAIRLDVPKPGLFKVDKMHRAESAKLLYWGLDESQIDDTMSTNALLDFLTDLPLAVKQASAYMAERNMSTARYLGHCQSSNKTLIRLLSKDFGDRGRYETTHNPVATTWLISFEYLSRDAPLAADYLQFISFLSEKNIPRSLLPDEDDELEADEALGTLQAYAFVTERLDTGWFDVHRLVRLVMHNWLAEKGEQVAWLTNVINRLDRIYPIPEHENKDVWMDYLSHAQAALETRAEATDKSRTSNLLLKVGQSSYKLGQYAAAKATHHKSLELRIKALDREGQFAAAKAIHRKVLELRTKVLGAEYLDTLSSINALVLALDRQGQYAAVEEMHCKVLELKTKVLGVEHLDTLGSINNLALALDRQGQYVAAEAMHRKVLEVRTKVLGAEHPNTLSSINALVLALDGQGQYAAVEEIHRKVLELKTKVLGVEHPDTLSSINNLALALDRQGQYVAAEAIYRKVLELRTKVLGAEHLNTLSSMHDLARALYRQGQYVAAEAMHRKVLELATEVLGAEHPNTLISMNDLARVL